MSDREPDFIDLTADFKNLVKDILKNPVYKMMDTLEEKKSGSSYKVFTYVQALEYAADKKLKYLNIESTLLKLESSPKGLAILQIFIDDAGEIVPKGRGYLGRKVTAEEIDRELKDIFDGAESVVINLP